MDESANTGQNPVPPSSEQPVEYIAYPKAMHRLATRLDATPEELAAWIFQGPEDGGLAAYTNANELEPPPRFYFTVGSVCPDYVAPLMACWFNASDIDMFSPAERYVTGRALMKRWSAIPGINVEPYIRAKIAESRLIDWHPIYGGTQGTFSEHSYFPSLASGLFLVANVESIEASDMEVESIKTTGIELESNASETLDSFPKVQSAINQAGPAPRPEPIYVGPTATFLAMDKLAANELSISIVGDRAESGLGANNMLEVSARMETRRIGLAELNLIDRRRATLNGEGGLLVGLSRGLMPKRNDANTAKVRRLRVILRRHLGIRGDPFYNYQKDVGWAPRFSIVDRRGLADDRAAREAERHTVSLDQLIDCGRELAASDQLGDAEVDENDAAAAWLKENDPERRA